MPSTARSKPVHVTLLGDSTIDNRIWVDGLYKNRLFTRLGIGHSTSAQRIHRYNHGLIKPELSVVENLRVKLPSQYQIHDGTNDGFTSSNVLSGGNRSKVFGPNTFSMFPDQFFAPLDEHEADIRRSDHIVLSVGGNDIREFLQATLSQRGEYRQVYIKRAFPEVLSHLKDNYLAIIRQIRALNPNGRIVMMTQYYPSAVQNNYHIYQFMKEVGKALKIGGNPPDPMNVIQHLVAEIFRGVISELDVNNVVIADVTSSLNPFDSKNHTSQIEPSGQGGEKIAKMLHHLVTSPVKAGQVYRFTPAFFDDQSADSSVISEAISVQWNPLHPRVIQEAEQAYHLTNSNPAPTNYSFILMALAGLAVTAVVITLLWIFVPTIGAIAGTTAVCTVAGYGASRMFAPALIEAEQPMEPRAICTV